VDAIPVAEQQADHAYLAPEHEQVEQRGDDSRKAPVCLLRVKTAVNCAVWHICGEGLVMSLIRIDRGSRIMPQTDLSGRLGR
jgi:hypothetical protein